MQLLHNLVQHISPDSNHYNLINCRYLVNVNSGHEMNLYIQWHEKKRLLHDEIMCHLRSS